MPREFEDAGCNKPCGAEPMGCANCPECGGPIEPPQATLRDPGDDDDYDLFDIDTLDELPEDEEGDDA